MAAIFYVGVFCDHGACEADERGDYMADDRDHAFACLRRDLRGQGWSCDERGDFCPEHHPASGARGTLTGRVIYP